MPDIDKLIAELTLDEKVSLTAGADLWSTVGVERLGIPKVRLTDGPNGARGPIVPGEGTSTSACVPCGSALGATWDPALVEEVGRFLGQEARSKGCRVLLAPTVNIHRSPLAGRNFECYSEDPLLSGRTAAAYVRGVQSQGVATTVKHFVGNDAETERHTVNSVIDDRALREIYLVPFEMAVRDGGTLGMMTGYNRLNGPWCAEHEWLLRDVLRGEWGFDGFVVSDWFAMGSTAGSARAGLDLEMPGPARFYAGLYGAVTSSEVDEEEVDALVRHQLQVWERLGALDDGPTDTGPRPDDRELVRRAAASAMVLLSNDGLLPFDPARVQTLAVIGPNADRAQIMGGGSANFRPDYRISPLDALRERFAAVRHARGCDIDRVAPPLVAAFDVEVFAGADFEGELQHRTTVPDSRMMWFGAPAPGLDAAAFSARASATFTPDESGEYTFTLVQAGRARLKVDGVTIIDGIEDPPPRGTQLFGLGSAEVTGSATLSAGTPHQVVIEYSSTGAFIAHGVVIGCRRPVPDDLLATAVRAAAESDAAVVIVGTNADWESEGYDRQSMDLPGAQDDLVRAVISANPNTVVVVNTGAPVTMDWAPEARAVMQVWFGGQEMAGALAEVLVGERDPGGRLPTTLPLRLEHNPSFGNFPVDNGEVRYGEGVLVGYRWYEARHLPVRYPFGHGLSYTDFEIGEPTVQQSGERVHIDVTVTNTGGRGGSEVVQCYVAPVDPRLVRPPKELKAFTKVTLGVGESTTVAWDLDRRAFAYWDPGQPGWEELRRRVAETTRNPPPAEERAVEPGWRVDPGVYELRIGRSSADIAHTVPVTIGPADA